MGDLSREILCNVHCYSHSPHHDVDFVPSFTRLSKLPVMCWVSLQFVYMKLTQISLFSCLFLPAHRQNDFSSDPRTFNL
jgi:hypothetical protein